MPTTIARQVRLPEEAAASYKVQDGTGQAGMLRGLSTLNVFIGSNNSGKSRLLRELFRAQPLPSVHDSALVRDIERLQHVALEARSDGSAQGHEPLLDAIARLDLLAYLTDENARSHQNGLSGRMTYLPPEGGPGLLQRGWNRHLERLREDWRANGGEGRGHATNRIYFPAYRTLRRFVREDGEESRDLFLEMSVNEYFGGERPHAWALQASNTKPQRAVFSGVGFHDLVHDLRLGNLGQRQLLEDFEEQISFRFFAGQPVHLIPKRDKAPVLHIKVGREAERPIHRLGDGLQQIIVLTFPLFLLGRQELMMFVEEPELYMHMGLQRDLIEAWLDPTFAPRAGTGRRQIFVATHSSQFIDLTLDHLDISVYRLTKRLPAGAADEEATPSFEVSLCSQPEAGVLADLGVRNSSLLLTNATIWVEGITDRMYFRRILDVLQAGDPRRVREDVHFSFVEYGGANVVHWSVLKDDHPVPKIEVERLCGRLILVADQDSARKEKRQQRIREVLGERFVVLPCREVENLVAPSVLTSVVAAMAPGATLPADTQRSAYRTQLLGRWLDKHVTWGGDADMKTFAAPSGTIKEKLEFARLACETIKTRDDLTADAVMVGQQLIDFVLRHNPGLASLRAQGADGE